MSLTLAIYQAMPAKLRARTLAKLSRGDLRLTRDRLRILIDLGKVKHEPEDTMRPMEAFLADIVSALERKG